MSDETTVGAPKSVAFDPFEHNFYDNPYTQYRCVREAGRVQPSTLGPVVLTHWADVNKLLRDPSVSVEDANSSEGGLRPALAGNSPERNERGAKAMLRLDPPDHTRLRRLVSRAFTPRTIERLRPRVGELVDAILDDLETRDGWVDLISELAFPLPFAVITDMLGMPTGDADQMREWSHVVSQAVDPILAMTNAYAIFEAGDRMREMVDAAVAWKRGRPDDDDLLNVLLHADDGGDVLSDQELVDNIVLLYIAGHETTVNLIGNGIYSLLRNPSQLDRLRNGSVADADAVEELLRYDSPVQLTQRIALRDIDIDDHAISMGERMMVSLGAANRDPAKFGPTADELDLGRPGAREHLSFGSGVHHCLGAALARMEGQVVIGTTVRRFPALELAAEPQWNGRMVLRGLNGLEVTLH